MLNNIEQIHSKSKSFITDYKKICTYLNVDNQYLINNINNIIVNYKKDYFNSETDDISYNIIKSSLQIQNNNERIFALNLILKF